MKVLPVNDNFLIHISNLTISDFSKFKIRFPDNKLKNISIVFAVWSSIVQNFKTHWEMKNTRPST